MRIKKYEKFVKITDVYVDDNTRETMISSRHFPIIRGLENATDEEIEIVKERYIQYERDYANPINKVKKLIRKSNLK